MRASRLLVAALLLHRRAALMRIVGVVSGLTRLELKHERVRVWYPKERAAGDDSAGVSEGIRRGGRFIAVPLLLDLGHGLPKLALACDSGPSNDPSCRLLREVDDAESAIFESAGNDFVFLPTAEIHVFGNTDYNYDHRRLFRFDGKRFEEVAQPFRYVGIEGTNEGGAGADVHARRGHEGRRCEAGARHARPRARR